MTRCGQEETGQSDEGSQHPSMQGTRDTFPGGGVAVPFYDGDGLHLIFRLFAMLRRFVSLQKSAPPFAAPGMKSVLGKWRKENRATAVT